MERDWSDQDEPDVVGSTITAMDIADGVVTLTLDGGRVLAIEGDWDVFASEGIARLVWRDDGRSA